MSRRPSLIQWRCAITPDAQHIQNPYSVHIETSSGQSIAIPVAFLTPEQVASFLQLDFKRLVQEAGLKGVVRAHVEHSRTADYEDVLHEVAMCLRRAGVEAA